MNILATTLRTNRRLKNLMLNDCRLSDLGFTELFETMSNSLGTIQIMDISENTLGRRGAEELANFIHSARSLSRLNMRKMNITDAVMLKIQPALEISRIKCLILSENKIGDAAAATIASILNKSEITELDLSWNSIRTVGGAALAVALESSSKLQSLDLSWNAIGSGSSSSAPKTVALALSASFSKNSSLTHLDLSQNHLGLGTPCVAFLCLTSCFVGGLAYVSFVYLETLYDKRMYYCLL